MPREMVLCSLEVEGELGSFGRACLVKKPWSELYVGVKWCSKCLGPYG